MGTIIWPHSRGTGEPYIGGSLYMYMEGQDLSGFFFSGTY